MAPAPGDLGSIFVAVTGRSTITERQRDDVPVRLDEGTEPPVSVYVDAAARADGLEDAIDDLGSS